MPFCSARSCRPPAVTQMPMEADSSPGICSVTMRKPLASVVLLDSHVAMRSLMRAFKRAEVVGDPGHPLRPVIQVRHARGKGGRMPRRRLDRVGEFRRMRGGQRDHRRAGPRMLLGHLHADGGMRAQQLAGVLASVGAIVAQVSSSDARPDAKMLAAAPASRPG